MPDWFRTDLYRGAADDYDRFRVAYPPAMVADLMSRVRPSGRGRLLDLACGTGQIAFAVKQYFDEVWAVDQEPDMVAVVEAKARGGRVRAIASAAERLDAREAWFDLVTIGNAFHRLRRETVASQVFRWLKPGGHLALLWSRSSWVGPEGWQQVMSAVMDAWKVRAGAADRVPDGWDRGRRERPDRLVLTEAGLELVGYHEFPTAHDWTIDELIGFVYSTSFLSRRALGPLAEEFAADLRRELTPYERSGRLHETIDFAYELAHRPITGLR
jgi:SAM-dependent methyltransferase